MVAEVLKPNVQDLQTDVIDLLEQITGLRQKKRLKKGKILR
jgi:hypothetical protein